MTATSSHLFPSWLFANHLPFNIPWSQVLPFNIPWSQVIENTTNQRSTLSFIPWCKNWYLVCPNYQKEPYSVVTKFCILNMYVPPANSQPCYCHNNSRKKSNMNQVFMRNYQKQHILHFGHNYLWRYVFKGVSSLYSIELHHLQVQIQYGVIQMKLFWGFLWPKEWSS